MKTDWKTFLANAGAVFKDNTVVHFGNPTRELKVINTGNIITDLSHQGLIAVYGDDAYTFLQSQFANDVIKESKSASQLNTYCNNKGRILSIFRMFFKGRTYYLQLPYELVEEIINKLKVFVFRSKVTIEDASDSFVRIGCSGKESESQLKNAIGHFPDTVNAVLQTESLAVIRLPGSQPRFEIIGDLEAVKQIWGQLDVHSAPIGANAWDLLDILAGVPTILKATTEEFIPQMVNLQALNAISFEKGCYPGQEIVARMHYLGKVKKRMYLVQIQTDQLPAPGENLYDADASNDQSIGKIVSAQSEPDGTILALAVVIIARADKGAVRLRNKAGEKLTFLSLPYEAELSSP